MTEDGIEVHMRILNEHRAAMVANVLYGALGCEKLPELLGGIMVFESIWDGAAVYVLFANGSRIFVAEVYAPIPAQVVSVYRDLDGVKAHLARLPWVPQDHLEEVYLTLERKAAELHRPLTWGSW